MAEYKLAQRAEDKLVEIYASTENTFGRYQADAYSAGFERTFGLLADFPRIGIRSRNSRTGIGGSDFSRTIFSILKSPME